MDLSAGTRTYLKGEASWPEVSDLTTFDDHLAGLEVVRRVEATTVTELLVERVWEPAALKRAFAVFVDEFGAERLRFATSDGSGDQEVVRFCTEQALRHALALPGSMAGFEPSIDPSWVSAESLKHLESLGFGERALDSIASMIADGLLQLPDARDRSALVAAAAELVEPSHPSGPEELASLSEQLHKWFARRPGSLFRSLLLAEFDGGKPLRESYYQGHDLSNVNVFDPFLGGGTPAVEAN